MRQTVQFLKTLSHFSPFYKWALKESKFFKKSETNLTPISRFIYSDQPRHCFFNSQMTALNAKNHGENVEYWEGWYLPKGLIPIEHGWNVYKGKVYDVTGSNRFITEEYLGVRIPLGLVAMHQVRTGHSDAMLLEYWETTRIKLKRIKPMRGEI